jgi:superfamily I DNA/RNA helicase
MKTAKKQCILLKKIKELVQSGQNRSEICVLYRTNFQSTAIEKELLAENIKYQVLGVLFLIEKK